MESGIVGIESLGQVHGDISGTSRQEGSQGNFEDHLDIAEADSIIPLVSIVVRPKNSIDEGKSVDDRKH